MSITINENGYLNEARTKVLVEKWTPKYIGKISEALVKEGIGELGLEKRAAIAKCLENTDTYIKTMLEGVQSTDIGQYKRFALDMVTTVIANLIAPDLVSVQPIENRVGMVNYIRYTYNNTKGSTAAGTAFADARNLYSSDPNFTAKDVLNETIVVTGTGSGPYTYTGRFAWIPMIKGEVRVIIAGSTYVDNQLGALGTYSGSAFTPLSGATVNYDDGTLSFTSSSADIASVMTTYKYNNEIIPMNNIPEIGIKIETIPIVAESRRLSAYYSFEAAFELKKEYGSDMQTLLNAQATSEIQREIDVEICADLYRYASAGAELSWSKTQPYGVSLKDHYASFETKIEEGSAMINQSTQRVFANWITCGTQVAVVIAACPGWNPAKRGSVNGPYFAGTLGGRKVFVNPQFDPNVFVLGYKGETLLNAGYVYAPYMPIMTTDLVQLKDMAGQKGWATMYGKAVINDKFYIRGRITA